MFIPDNDPKKKESAKRQEMGPKKFDAMVEKQNKFYDEHLAGRKNPKTGDLYHKIDFKDPRKQTIKQKFIDGFQCECGNSLSLSRTTFMTQCSNCKSLYKILRDKMTDEFEVELVKSGKDK
jgi:hypothetical protein